MPHLLPRHLPALLTFPLLTAVVLATLPPLERSADAQDQTAVQISAIVIERPQHAAGLQASVPTAPRVGPAANPHPLPSSYVPVRPTDDLQRLINAHPPGTTYLLTAGVHRLGPINTGANDVYVGEPGAVVNGSRVLSSFTREGSYWVVTGQTQGATSDRAECLPGWEACKHNELLFIDDVMLRQVTRLADVRAGTWFFDYAADKIYLADDPTGRKVETAVQPRAFWFGGRGVTIRGLVFEKYASPAQFGVVAGHDWVVEYNEFRWNNGGGVSTTPGMVIRNNHIHRNGQIGIIGQGNDVLVDSNEIAHNNTAGFDFMWEAGGTKFVRTTRLTVRGNYVHNNDGPGLWTDIDNIYTVYEDNLVTDNAGAGIFHEVSYDAVIRNNVSLRNGATALRAGILVVNSRNVEVYGNHLSGNKEGLRARQEARETTGLHGALVVSNLHVHGNRIEMSEGFSGLTVHNGDTSLFTSHNNRFTANTYELSGGTQRHHWRGRFLDPAGWRAHDQDLDGTWL